VKLSGWGRYPVIDAHVYAPRSIEDLREFVVSKPSVIARGSGRSYGDSAINPPATIEMRYFNRILAFDANAGQLTAEAGVILGDIVATFLLRGWFPTVTPGTKFVTLGGMIAADVHGKNHHRDGSFGKCVDWIEVMGGDGEVRRCSREEHADLFEYTLGGMGLTGIILRAAIRLRPVETGWVRQTTIPAPNLEAAMAAFEQAQDVNYSVAWIDCLASGNSLGRSLLYLGEHDEDGTLEVPRGQGKSIHFDMPTNLLNRFTIQAFNTLYYHKVCDRVSHQRIHYEPYFYPLDSLYHWNRLYGRNGFLQFLMPLKYFRRPLEEFLNKFVTILDLCKSLYLNDHNEY